MGKEFEIRRSSTDRSFFFRSPLSKMAVAMTMERQKQRAITYGDLMKQVKAAAPPLPWPSSSSWGGSAKQACICAPTSHPGSFKCHLHRIQASQKPSVPSSGVQAVCVVPLRSLKRDKVARRCMPPPSTKGIRKGASRLSKVETLSQTPAAKVAEAEPPQETLATGTESVPAVRQP